MDIMRSIFIKTVNGFFTSYTLNNPNDTCLLQCLRDTQIRIHTGIFICELLPVSLQLICKLIIGIARVLRKVDRSNFEEHLFNIIFSQVSMKVLAVFQIKIWILYYVLELLFQLRKDRWHKQPYLWEQDQAIWLQLQFDRNILSSLYFQIHFYISVYIQELINTATHDEF